MLAVAGYDGAIRGPADLDRSVNSVAHAPPMPVPEDMSPEVDERMFSHSDRFPTVPAVALQSEDPRPEEPRPEEPRPEEPRPWGLRRMVPRANILRLPYVRVVVDPATQTGMRFGPGDRPVDPIEAAKHGSSTGTERATQANRGDGRDHPSSADQDQTQDSDRD